MRKETPTHPLWDRELRICTIFYGKAHAQTETIVCIVDSDCNKHAWTSVPLTHGMHLWHCRGAFERRIWYTGTAVFKHIFKHLHDFFASFPSGQATPILTFCKKRMFGQYSKLFHARWIALGFARDRSQCFMMHALIASSENESSVSSKLVMSLTYQMHQIVIWDTSFEGHPFS